jgi:uncharacterized protein (TIGR03084 family)
MTTLPELLGDLDDEYADLHRVVADFGPVAPEWDMATPAEGWAVRDQISHLAFFDEAGRTAMVEPDRFAATTEEMLACGGDPMAVHLVRGRGMNGTELLAWWEESHRGMMDAFGGADPSARVPWFGPPMGVLSFISARLMETWAHGQDVVDALGLDRRPTDRLRHVAHLGVRARPFSYLVRERPVPAGRIDVVLVAPSGEEWRWAAGDPVPGGPIATIEGPALDFCLVVTQRRNLADTSLAVTGESAADWMSVAQAFAGPPGPGRAPSSP